MIKTTKTATIRVSNVGQNFGCCAVVVAGNHHTLYTTRTYPYSMRSQAYQDAEGKARELGYRVDSDEESV